MNLNKKNLIILFLVGFLLGIVFFHSLRQDENISQSLKTAYQLEELEKSRIDTSEFFEYCQVSHQLGTRVKIKIHAKENSGIENILKASFDRIHAIESLMSCKRPDSILFQINATGKAKGYLIPSELGMIIGKAGEFSRLTGGAFDITVKPLLDLYKTASMEKRKPTQEEISEILNHVGYKKVALNEELSNLTLSNDNMALDLGGIAKGYAIDEVAAIIRQKGVNHALINAGGDIYLIGGRADGKDWKTGIQDPEGNSGDIMTVLAVRDCAVCTSGNYARGYWTGEDKVSHIIDPRSGEPCDDNPSVTVVAKTALMADTMATALSIIGKKGLRIIEKLKDVEAMIFSVENGKLVKHSSSGFEGFVTEHSR